MGDDEQTYTEENEIIFSARYSPSKVWFTIITLFMFPMWILLSSAYHLTLKGQYSIATGCSLLGTAILLFTLDSLLFKELLFYRNRVVKVWRFLGQRTIYYSRAKVTGSSTSYRYFLRVFQIKESQIGKALFIQVPISCIFFFFPPDVRNKISNIIDYLADDTSTGLKMFNKSSLPKEVIWPDRS